MAGQETQDYVVSPNQFLELAGKRFDAGDVVELTDDQAASLAAGVVSPKKNLGQVAHDHIKAAGAAAKATDLQSRGEVKIATATDEDDTA